MMNGRITESNGKTTIDESERREAGRNFRARLREAAASKTVIAAEEGLKKVDQSPAAPGHA
jgi:hypothetical protein